MIMLDDNDFREMMILMLNMYKKGNYDIKFHPFYDGAKVMVDLECLSSCFVAPRPSSAIFLDESQADLLHPLLSSVKLSLCRDIIVLVFSTMSL